MTESLPHEQEPKGAIFEEAFDDEDFRSEQEKLNSPARKKSLRTPPDQHSETKPSKNQPL